MARVEPVQESNLDLGTEVISGSKVIPSDRNKMRHIGILLLVIGVVVALPGIVVLYK